MHLHAPAIVTYMQHEEIGLWDSNLSSHTPRLANIVPMKSILWSMNFWMANSNNRTNWQTLSNGARKYFCYQRSLSESYFIGCSLLILGVKMRAIGEGRLMEQLVFEFEPIESFSVDPFRFRSNCSVRKHNLIIHQNTGHIHSGIIIRK